MWIIEWLRPIVAFVVAVLVLVTVHEWGHFWVARCFGIQVLRFSVGFGRPIWKHQGKSGTEYVIGIFPLGGYVKMLDADADAIEASNRPRMFNSQPVWRRLAVVLAGPSVNFLFAIIALWVVFSVGIEMGVPVIGRVLPASIAGGAGMVAGEKILSIDHQDIQAWPDALLAIALRLGDKGNVQIQTESRSYELPLQHWQVDYLNPDPLLALGLVPYHPPLPAVVESIQGDSPAAKAGLQAGDRIIKLNEQAVTDWFGLMDYIQRHPTQDVMLTVERRLQQGGELRRHVLPVTIARRLVGLRWQGFIGIKPIPMVWQTSDRFLLQYPVPNAFGAAVTRVYHLTYFNTVMLGKLLIGKLSLQSMGGPLLIFKTADLAFKQGVVVYLSFLAWISVMLGFVNLLPIPGLDGGHVLYYLIEIVRRRPVSMAAQVLSLRLGMIFLLLIIVQATINDVMRLL